jgi:hypothetical protein
MLTLEEGQRAAGGLILIFALELGEQDKSEYNGDKPHKDKRDI